MTDREPTTPDPSDPAEEEKPARIAPDRESDGRRPGAGAGLRWAIALFLVGALLVLLFGGPSPPA